MGLPRKDARTRMDIALASFGGIPILRRNCLKDPTYSAGLLNKILTMGENTLINWISNVLYMHIYFCELIYESKI